MTNRRSYKDYVEHQARKLSKIRGRLDRHEGAFTLALTVRLTKLVEQGVSLAAKSVLCLGARRGAEVQVFRDFSCFAWGIDLNPGEKNRYVTVGDFQALEFASESVDVVYTNSLDHAFYLLGALCEIHRVLKPKGIFISEVVRGTEEGYTFDEYDVCTWDSSEEVLQLIHQRGFEPSGVPKVCFDVPWPGVQALWIKE